MKKLNLWDFVLGFVVIFGVIMLVFAALVIVARGDAYQCATGPNRAKTDSSVSADYDELHLADGQIITAVYVKAGTACIIPDGTCYAITDGGIGYNFVIVERVDNPGPDCQAISHIEVEYTVQSTPTNTSESSQTPTETGIPEPSETPVASSTPENPTPTGTTDPTDTATPEPSITPTPNFTLTPVPTFCGSNGCTNGGSG